MVNDKMRDVLTLLKPVLVLTLLLNSASCRSPDVILTEHAIHDTLYLSREKYDSIYLSENSSERYHPSSFHYDTLAQAYCKVDTLYKERSKTEFRYKLLHDTTYIHQVDTIPKMISVPESPPPASVPLWWKLTVVATLFLLFKHLVGKVLHPPWGTFSTFPH